MKIPTAQQSSNNQEETSLFNLTWQDLEGLSFVPTPC
uniref:Uncharacterized protein n=1 Tax=Anguilla anguilla TaxID=7936 RepID=A0A0E9WEV2_ANGAN